MTERWPTRPPRGQCCDASRPPAAPDLPGFPGDVSYATCRELATETVRQVRNGRPLWLCAAHVDELVASGDVYRNPRRRT